MSSEAQDQPVPSRRLGYLPFGWLGLLALAWVVYELTHSPALAAVFICLKFGWEDFRAAGWLWRSDPDTWRRRAMFWLYLSWGLWKTAGVAFLMSLAFALITPRNAVPQAIRQQLLAFLGTFLTSLTCFGLSTLMTAIACALAWRGDVRLWLDSGVHRARRFDFWPPTPFCIARHNRLGTLLVTALALGFVAGILALILVVPPGGGALVGFVASIIAPVLVVVSREVITSKVRAETPEECWPEEWDRQQPWQDDPEMR